MRKAGVATSKDNAQKLTNAFYANNIEAQVHEEHGVFTFWVVDDNQLEAARDIFLLLEEHPDDPAFKTKAIAAVPAKPTSDIFTDKVKKNRSRNVDVRREVFGQSNFSGLPVTIFLIAASVLLTLASENPAIGKVIRSLLFYSKFMGNSFPEIRDGEIWRIITPIFLHGGMLHLFFNMLWLYQLGGAIEKLEKPWYLAAIVFGLGAVCNTAQYLISGPNFLGMSGVVYGLLGYTWMMGMYQPRSRYFISQGTVSFMMVWLVLCLVGVIPNVANTQHIAGMIAGSAFGFSRAKLSK